MKKAILIIVFGLLWCNVGFANNPFLKGLDTFQFSVLDIDRCGVKKEDIETSAKYIILNSGIKLLDSKDPFKETIQITIMIQDTAEQTSPRICYGYVKIEVGRFVEAPNSKGHGGPAPVFYYDEAIIFGHDEVRFKTRLINNFEKMMKDFVILLKESQ